MSKFTNDQIDWAKKQVELIADKGTWIIPANGCSYQFFHSVKEIHLVQGDPTQDNWHELNTQLFALIGWEVSDRRTATGGKTFKVDNPHGQGKSW